MQQMLGSIRCGQPSILRWNVAEPLLHQGALEQWALDSRQQSEQKSAVRKKRLSVSPEMVDSR